MKLNNALYTLLFALFFIACTSEPGTIKFEEVAVEAPFDMPVEHVMLTNVTADTIRGEEKFIHTNVQRFMQH